MVGRAERKSALLTRMVGGEVCRWGVFLVYLIRRSSEATTEDIDGRPEAELLGSMAISMGGSAAAASASSTERHRCIATSLAVRTKSSRSAPTKPGVRLASTS